MIALDCRRFAYDDGVVLSGVSLTVAAGETVTVVGASGSGKTTLARLLAGQTGQGMGARFEGSLTLAGERLDFAGTGDDPRIDPAAWSAHVGYVAQNAWAQLSMMCGSVAEEIAFGPANRGVPAARLRAVVRETADRLNLGPLLAQDPRRLSGGQLQKTIIAAAVASGPGLLVLDEPFQGLDAAGRADLTAVLGTLAAAGTAIVIFEPLLPSVNELGSRFIALAEGRMVYAGSWTEAQAAGLGRYGIGREGSTWDGSGPVSGAAVPPAVRPGAEVAAALAGVGFTYPRPRSGAAPRVGLDGVRLTLYRGEALALLGPNGSGKSTLLQHLNGLLRPDTGSVTVLGNDVGPRATGELAGTVGFLFQNTDQQLFERTVRREVAYGPLAAGAGRTEAGRRADEALARLQLDGFAETHPHELCFSRRRLLALASLMATRPAVWALDEPTAGLDSRGRELMVKAVSAHLADGGAVLLATHDLGFAEAVCHRAVTLQDGRIVRETVYC